MKIKITMKDPDGPRDCVEDAVREDVRGTAGINEEEVEMLVERRTDKVMGQLHPWLKYGEYIEVEFDLDAGTATVIKRPQ